MTPNSSSSPPAPPHLRLVRATAAPAFSVVMSGVCEEDQAETLTSVVARCKELGAELIVALRAGVDCAAIREERSVRTVSVPADATPADVRRLAMAKATGDIVFVLDRSVLAEDHWCERIRGFQASSRRAAGPSNERRERVRVDWAEFLAVRGVIPGDRSRALESFTPTFASDARPRGRSILTKWTEQLGGVERVRPARQ